MRAAADGQLDLVRRLALDCSVNAADAHGNTALMVAAAGGHLDVVHFLAGECGANVNAAGKHGNTAVMLAAAFGHVAVVRCLAKKYGADVNAREEGGYTALLWAAAERHVRVVCCLVGDCRADVNARSSNGYSAVMFVAEYGPIHVIRYLVRECGADVNAADSRGTTVLIEAASKGRIDLVRCLLGICRAEINAADQDGNTALIKAAAEVHIDVIWYLAGECGADVNAADRRGVTALMIVASIGRMDVVRFLAGECGALVNATDEDGDTALIKAAAEGHVDVVRYLAGECGADVNAAYKSGTTALMKAAAFGHISVVRYLAINCRADVNAIDEGGYSAIRFAVDRGYQEIQRILTPFLDVKQLEVSVVATSDALPSNAKFDNKPSWFIAPSEIALVNFVESGSVGGEYRAKWLDADAAVKLFLADASSHTVFEDEVRLWNQLRHPNILKIYALGESVDVTREREARWEAQWGEQIEIFVSEASKTYLLLEELKSQEERSAFLASLKLEIEHSSKYTPGQLGLLQKAYEQIASKLETDGLSKLTPDWFIPWYELIVDKHNQLGRGGFGSVFRAKWLDSDVVVKHLIGSGDLEIDMSSAVSSFASYASWFVNTETVLTNQFVSMDCESNLVALDDERGPLMVISAGKTLQAT
ncbi:hypothetical protein KRP22_004449 [Phytophthora ramorum]|nr:Ankyrin repeat domain-containing protein 50 [Phytophthora ramorum]